MSEPTNKIIKLICGCCAAPMQAFVVSSTPVEEMFGIVPCICKGVTPISLREKEVNSTTNDKQLAQVLYMEFYRGKLRPKGKK